MFTRTPTRTTGENKTSSESGEWEQNSIFGTQDLKSSQVRRKKWKECGVYFHMSLKVQSQNFLGKVRGERKGHVCMSVVPDQRRWQLRPFVTASHIYCFVITAQHS